MRKCNCLVRLCCYCGYYIPININTVEWVDIIRSAAWTGIIWFHFVKLFLLIPTNLGRLQTLEAASGFVYSLSGALIFTTVNLNYKACWKLVNKLSALNSEAMLTNKQATIIGRICKGLVAFEVVCFFVSIVGIMLVYVGGYVDEFYVKNHFLPFKYESLSSWSKEVVYLLMTILSASTNLQYLGTSRMAIYATANILYIFVNFNEEMDREVQKQNFPARNQRVVNNKNDVIVLDGPSKANPGTREEMQDTQIANSEDEEIVSSIEGIKGNGQKSTLGTLKYKHEELCKVVDLFESFLSIPVGITVFSTVISSCINLYMMANASGILGMTNASFFLFTAVLQSGIFLTCGILINDKVSTKFVSLTY